jgi:tetratricopeptide (TPR) repeat protein
MGIERSIRTMHFILAVLFAAATAAPELDPGLGTLHWTVSTKNAMAQKYFDQGMKYVYAFNHEQAIRSFEEATRRDPELAMGYWGAALALGPNINLDVDPDREKKAYDAIHAAAQHLGHASAKERDLVAALTKRYTNDPQGDLKKLAADYSQAMGELAKKYPNDDDVAVLYAESVMDLRPWKFWSHDGKPAPGTEEGVATLQKVLKRNPTHLGANHYLIHMLEASPHPERAVTAAERLPKLAPSAGHLVHMPAHVYERTGNYAAAAAANERAATADREFIKKNGGENIYAMMYYNHNLQFGAASHAMTGNFNAAMTLANEIAQNVTPMLKEMPPIEVTVAYPVQVLARFGRWRDVLKTKPIDAGPLSAALWLYAHGSALAQLGDVSGATSDRKALDVWLAKVPDDVGMLQNSYKAVGMLGAQVLDARIALASGRTNDGIAALEKAVAMEDTLDYNEPPDWWNPVRETLGAALLRAGRAADAEHVFRDDLARNRNNPRSLYGLAQALKAQKKDATKTAAAFRAGWKGGSLTVADY